MKNKDLTSPEEVEQRLKLGEFVKKGEPFGGVKVLRSRNRDTLLFETISNFTKDIQRNEELKGCRGLLESRSHSR